MSEAYDPTAPEGDARAGSQYLSKRDLRIVIAGFLLLTIILWPIYLHLRRDAWKTECAHNMRSIANAMTQYAEQNDGRLPPLVQRQGRMVLLEDGYPVTWATVISPYLSPRNNMMCPAAAPEERMAVRTLRTPPVKRGIDPPRGTEYLTYGMYAPYSSLLLGVIANPGTTILIAETANRGARDTFNPIPYETTEGEDSAFDAFGIGFDNDNFVPNAETQYVTRLAFYGTRDAVFAEDAAGRHDFLIDGRRRSGVHGITAAGTLARLLPPQAQVQQGPFGPTGRWETPAQSEFQR
jgi:hypothetical protein